MKASLHLTYVDESYLTALPAGEEWWPRFIDYEDVPDELVTRAKAAEEKMTAALKEVRAIATELQPFWDGEAASRAIHARFT